MQRLLCSFRHFVVVPSSLFTAVLVEPGGFGSEGSVFLAFSKLELPKAHFLTEIAEEGRQARGSWWPMPL